MIKGKLKFDFLTSASNNFSKNYISGSMLSFFHFYSDTRICIYTLYFSLLTMVSPSPLCLSLYCKIIFCKKFFAKYSMVICGKLIFSWNTEKITLEKSCLYPSVTMMWIVSGWRPSWVLFPCCRSNGHVLQQHNESIFLELLWCLHSISFNFQLPPLV